jgi:alpha-1,2-mannosyltransferase
VSTAAPAIRAGRLPNMLPPVAMGAFALVVGGVIWASQGTFAFDFLAYHQAAERVLAGERLYDTSFEQTGGFGLFYYPPPFVLPILPLALLDGGVASIVWVGVLLAAFFGAIAVLPVRAPVKWLLILLAGLSWPVAYTFKLGQVGPLLMLAFAVGWRWMDVPARLGSSATVGALIKLQPGLVLAWAALTRRWHAVAVGVGVGLVASALATVVVGIGAWPDYVQLLRQVSDPITTPHNFTPGAVPYQLGAPAAIGAVIQAAVAVAVVAAWLVSVRWATSEASFLVTLVASQLLSPVLWDHYAVLLLLPVAWLLQRGHWWAVAVPLAVALGVPAPPAVYPTLFAAVLVAVLVVGASERRAGAPASAPA